MTDYWVSSKKHYCEVCKCWISGSTLNVKNHEASARHISSLRKKLIDSHRRQLEKKEQDEFEKAEIARLNAVTVDGSGSLEEIGITGLTSSPILMYGRVLRPPVDKEKEQARIAETIGRVLSGAPVNDPDTTAKTTWVAFIDHEDGTLTYYNNNTGIKTKKRPHDFDGVLPSASSSLTSNWVLKFDPSRGARYYQNTHTGEIRWMDHQPTLSPSVPDGSKETIKTASIAVSTSSTPTTAVKTETQIKIKLEPVDPAECTKATSLNHNAHVKSEPEDGPSPADPYAPSNQGVPSEPVKPAVRYTTHIGQWEVVKPEDSVFGNSIVSLEPYLNPPKDPPREPDMFDVIREATYETPLLNMDDLQLQEKRTFEKKLNTTDSEEPVQFVKRKLPKKK